jgi:hypothetical protein
VVKSLGQGAFRAGNIAKRIQKTNLNNMAGAKVEKILKCATQDYLKGYIRPQKKGWSRAWDRDHSELGTLVNGYKR